MNISTPLTRPSLHEELVDRLREAIVDGTMEPGSKVPEKSLCETLGVSRTPLREALKVLANEGLVVLEPNRGARVATVTMEELEATFPVIAALERLAGELACDKATDAQIAHIRVRTEAMVRHHADADRSAYFKANQDIHDALMEAADNPVLSQNYRVLSSRAKRARFLANISQDRWDQAVREHQELLAALEARDGVRLGGLLQTHILNKFAALQASAEGSSHEA
ncbi:MAG: GntR family transcriptional regulator [Pseudomonadota bacterium]